MKLIILQSIPASLSLVEMLIQKKFPELNQSTQYVSSFDQTILEILPQISPKEELYIVTSDMFHDEDSPYKRLVPEIIPSKDKNSLSFASLVEKTHPKAKVFLYSLYKPNKMGFLYGVIKKQTPDGSMDSMINFLTQVREGIQSKISF